MAYQIKQLAALAGVSVRTLRYYDQIGLLPPAYVGDNGYRYYETAQVDQLQQICLYRELQVPLAKIRQLLNQSPAEVTVALQAQYRKLIDQRHQLDWQLQLLKTTIKTQAGGIAMTDTEKFAAFKQAKLASNEHDYGDELCQKYDQPTLDAATAKFGQLSAQDYAAMQATEQQLLTALAEVLASGALVSDTAQQVYTLHRQWLSYTWPDYTAAKHRGLATMYLADDRFTAYYDDRVGDGATAALVAIIEHYAQD